MKRPKSIYAVNVMIEEKFLFVSETDRKQSSDLFKLSYESACVKIHKFRGVLKIRGLSPFAAHLLDGVKKLLRCLGPGLDGRYFFLAQCFTEHLANILNKYKGQIVTDFLRKVLEIALVRLRQDHRLDVRSPCC